MSDLPVFPMRRPSLLLSMAVTLLVTACDRHPSTAPAASTPPPIDTLQALPTGLKHKGTIDKILRWSEADGEHVLVASHGTREFHSAEYGDAVEDWLYAAQYRKVGDTYDMLWKLNDSTSPCPVDHVAAYYQRGIQVTDLDSNGVHEVTLAYRVTCAGDVSPLTQKVILRERSQKYALRGTTMDGIQISNGELPPTEPRCPPDAQPYSINGCYESDKDFVDAPQPFLAHAQQVWKTVLKEHPIPQEPESGK
ncbi:M949_RS01915 family surface polysaccharide biosynthesis protein [Chitinivorax sp. B]|uniref:M949_RS01915 family surface polysaccharide biosynthesis protein n=1 Tax=Chitinivorax sp. B TaxID=2502235 RepID=UPI0010F8EC83|nr:hypothetical protein [Chitinivorax sp. B]